jgi:hypothetical protein
MRLMILAFCALAGTAPVAAQVDPDLFTYRGDQQARWISPENRTGAKSAGGLENLGAKGHAFETLKAGQSLTIDRMWMTVQDRSPEALRSLKLEIFWDGAATPAVSVPLGDFYLQGAGEMRPMETALLASPEGRSFVSYIPMPFRKAARAVITNETASDNLIYFDVDYRALPRQAPGVLYFHAWWSRDRATTPGKDFDILPLIAGRGRFLGAAVTVQTDPAYGKTWWGEGEVRITLDGDPSDKPTLVGTGTEDYIGSAWGQGVFVNRFTGSPVADESRGRWSFYRFHVPDPIYFRRSIEVRLQQIGGAPKDVVLDMQRKGVRLIPVTIASANAVHQLLTSRQDLSDPTLPDGWTNFYRSDDVAAVAFFYLDRPDRVLPALAPPEARRATLRAPAPPK